MVCSYCHGKAAPKGNHNIRTCQAFHRDQIAEMILLGETKENIKARLLDLALPGAGVAYQAICKVKQGYDAGRVVTTGGKSGTNKLEHKRKIIEAIYGELKS